MNCKHIEYRRGGKEDEEGDSSVQVLGHTIGPKAKTKRRRNPGKTKVGQEWVLKGDGGGGYKRHG